jgi:hypothetical protein
MPDDHQIIQQLLRRTKALEEIVAALAGTAISDFAATLLDDADAPEALTTLGVSTFIQSLLGDASDSVARATLGIATGTYAPTLSNTTNVAASSIASSICKYIQVGSFAIVVVVVNVDPTAAAGATTVLGISLPIPTDVTATTQVMGIGVDVSASEQNGAIRGNVANDTAELVFAANDLAQRQWNCLFIYQI